MKLLIKLATLCSFFFLVQNSFACQELNWTAAQRAENSREVYIGRVTSISIPELDNRILTKKEESFLIRGAERVVRIKIYEKLKGERENVIEIKLNKSSKYQINY